MPSVKKTKNCLALKSSKKTNSMEDALSSPLPHANENKFCVSTDFNCCKDTKLKKMKNFVVEVETAT